MKETKDLHEVPTREQVGEVIAMCEDYRNAAARLDENQRRLKKLRERDKESLSGFEQQLFQKDIRRTEEAIERDVEATAFFRWALTRLDARSECVMRQLYVDGSVWEDIEDNHGHILPTGTVGRIRSQSVVKMALEISKRRKELQNS